MAEMMAPPAGAGPAGGVPTAPSTQGPAQASPPQAQAPAGPALPDGLSQLQGALDTLTKFALAQRDQGNPAISEALKGLVMAMGTGGQNGQVSPQMADIPQGIPEAKPIEAPNKPINA